jgi:hypothetical protein
MQLLSLLIVAVLDDVVVGIAILVLVIVIFDLEAASVVVQAKEFVFDVVIFVVGLFKRRCKKG